MSSPQHPNPSKPKLDEAALKRLKSAYEDGVPEREILRRFKTNHTTYLAAIKGLTRGER